MMASVTMLAPCTGTAGSACPSPDNGTTDPAPSSRAPTILAEVRPLDLRIVMGATREGRRRNEFVARYHYLGYTTLIGARMRYAVHDHNDRPVAMLGFSTAA